MEKFKSKVNSFLNRQENQKPFAGAPPVPPAHTRPTGPLGTHMQWPPRLVREPQILGEIKDVNGRNIPRDIGRSVSLGGNLYYMFGDSFCFDDGGDFKGCSNNTIAYIPDLRNPTRSQYMTRDPKVPNFVPWTPQEDHFTKTHEKENKRIVLWCFGGIVEDQSRPGQGWLFFDKIETHGGMGVKGFGMGVARARIADGRNIVCDRVKGDHMVFGEQEPRFGSISATKAPDGWVYCLGGKELINCMARIRHDADFSERSNYQFLKKGGQWAPSYANIHELEPVLGDQAQGAIVYMPEHGPAGKPWVWIGVDKWMSSHIHVAAAEKPEGPYDLKRLMEAPKALPNSNHRYCIYPHLWAGDQSRGEIMISWSDDGQMGGKVIAARFWFQMA